MTDAPAHLIDGTWTADRPRPGPTRSRLCAQPSAAQVPPCCSRPSPAFPGAEALAEEVLGLLGLAVRPAEEDETLRLAAALPSRLTCTLQPEEAEHPLAASLVRMLERKAGRILANGSPTGVEVADATVRGGPVPASTAFAALAARRFPRPICCRDMPVGLTPEDLRR